MEKTPKVQKINYQKELDAILSGLPEGERPTLLLHSCCGPCSSYVLEYLCRYFRVTLLYYNPNIQPEAEFEKRFYWQKQLLNSLPEAGDVRLLEAPWRGEEFEAAVQGLEGEPEGGARCSACFALRLEETARQCARLGLDWFCTTLSVSPHKDAQRLNAIGAAMGARYGVRWLPADFKKREGYKRSVELAGRYGLYRQTYCGCRYSQREMEKRSAE